jgi:hypothetical protein
MSDTNREPAEAQPREAVQPEAAAEYRSCDPQVVIDGAQVAAELAIAAAAVKHAFGHKSPDQQASPAPEPPAEQPPAKPSE